MISIDWKKSNEEGRDRSVDHHDRVLEGGGNSFLCSSVGWGERVKREMKLSFQLHTQVLGGERRGCQHRKEKRKMIVRAVEIIAKKEKSRNS